jgi:hypothetical protein
LDKDVEDWSEWKHLLGNAKKERIQRVDLTQKVEPLITHQVVI